MANNFDLHNLYKQIFNRPFSIPEDVGVTPEELGGYQVPANSRERGSIQYSNQNIAFNKINALGKDVWFPVTIWMGNDKYIDIDACTIGVNVTKTIARTSLSERKGTVKEQFNIDDYKFNVRGFLIGKDRRVPEADILLLREMFESNQPIFLTGGYPELFLEEDGRVAVTNLVFPEVEGKSHYIRPFSLTAESDYINNLIID